MTDTLITLDRRPDMLVACRLCGVRHMVEMSHPGLLSAHCVCGEPLAAPEGNGFRVMALAGDALPSPPRPVPRPAWWRRVWMWLRG